jgi:hypothetical protein
MASLAGWLRASRSAESEELPERQIAELLPCAFRILSVPRHLLFRNRSARTNFVGSGGRYQFGFSLIAGVAWREIDG